MDTIQLAGWIGMILILGAYFLLSKGYLRSQDAAYQYFNLLGALGLAINAFAQKVWPIFVLEIIWGMIALSTLIKTGRE